MAVPHSPDHPIDIYEDDSAHEPLAQYDAQFDEHDDTLIHNEVEDDDRYSGNGDDVSDEDSGMEEGDAEEDPFSTSVLVDREADEFADGQVIVPSIETPYTPSHTHDYSFSRTTPVHIDDRVDPLLNYVEENSENLRDTSLYRGSGNLKPATDSQFEPAESRKVSESVSTLPDELEYYRSSLPGRSPLSISQTHHGSRHGSVPRDRAQRQVHSSNPRQHQHSLSTPMAVPLPSSPAHSRSNSAFRNDYRPVFRNPSSVRAMQLSSPSPPPFETSPLSGRKLRREATPSRDGAVTPLRSSIRDLREAETTPSRQSPSRNKGQRKEYPLVLLHCTLSLLEMPAAYPMSALEAAGVSERTKRDVGLLARKLDNTVLERGLLLQHPGDDYELLEERVLESLELRKARIGGCGHFRSTSVDSDGRTVKSSERTDEDEEARCKDCERNVSPALLSSEEHDKIRRWDVRIYAANGLMRAGAWSAAWREMEKVDVEVGVWAPDEVKTKLEAWAAEHEQEEMKIVPSQAPDRSRQTSDSTTRVATALQHYSIEGDGSIDTLASRARTSHAGSMSKEAPHSDAQNGLSTNDAEPFRKAATRTSAGEVPLGTLLYNYITRQCGKNGERVLAIAAVILALCLALHSFNPEPQRAASPAIATAAAAAAASKHDTHQHASMPGMKASGAGVSEADVRTPHELDVDEIVRRVQLGACTFPAGGQSPEMTAVPRADAAKVLGAMAAAEAAVGPETVRRSTKTGELAPAAEAAAATTTTATQGDAPGVRSDEGMVLTGEVEGEGGATTVEIGVEESARSAQGAVAK